MSLTHSTGRTLACVAIALTPAFGLESHWPQFRGERGSGVSATARPPTKFGPTENVRWRVAVPWSPSSPCIWGDRIFLTTFADGKL